MSGASYQSDSRCVDSTIAEPTRAGRLGAAPQVECIPENQGKKTSGKKAHGQRQMCRRRVLDFFIARLGRRPDRDTASMCWTCYVDTGRALIEFESSMS